MSNDMVDICIWAWSYLDIDILCCPNVRKHIHIHMHPHIHAHTNAHIPHTHTHNAPTQNICKIFTSSISVVITMPVCDWHCDQYFIFCHGHTNNWPIIVPDFFKIIIINKYISIGQNGWNFSSFVYSSQFSEKNIIKLFVLCPQVHFLHHQCSSDETMLGKSSIQFHA